MIGRGLVVVVAGALILGGCSGVRRNLPGWLVDPPLESASAPAVSGQYYAAVEGLAVRAKPSGSSAVVGHLALHERVTRSALEAGYAHIVSASGVDGWVDNAQLLWRLPSSGTTTAPAPIPASEDESTKPAPPPEPPARVDEGTPEPSPSPVVEEPVATPPSPPVPAPDPQPAPKRPAPSTSFDPF